MISFYNIFTIARFELKTLSRSWFLRIFAALAIVIILLMDLAMFTDAFGGFTSRTMYGLSSALPYLNLLYFNLAQAIITVFLAADFLKRDRKLDTTDAIYIRSMTNTDYVAGKALGIFSIFIILNLIVVALSFIINLFGNQPNVTPLAYVYYIFMISIPTLVFMIGLTFLFMTLVRNQAITFILLLGYIGLTLFYLGLKFNYIFDYTGFYIPLAFSDLVGFGHFTQLMLHRITYLLLGISFTCFTMYFFNRLPQSKIIEKGSLVVAIILLVFAGGVFIKYMGNIYTGEELRESMIELNTKYKSAKTIDVQNYNIELDHLGNEIKVNAELNCINNNDELNQIILNLNPSLEISKISLNNSEIKFQRNKHLILIDLVTPLKQNDRVKLNIEYLGTTDDEAANIFVDETQRQKPTRIQIMASDKIYSFISPSYVMLTKETMWYPVPGVTYTPEAQFSNKMNFANYKLKVKTNSNLLPISQGNISNISDGEYLFESDRPIPQISLSIGEYEKKSIQVDSVEYNLFVYNKHDYYNEYFTEINDTLPKLIKELKEDYERDLSFEYPYKRFSIVETPIQFYWYPKLWTSATAWQQPEIIFFPENAVSVDGADFKIRQRMNERMGNRSGQVSTPQEEQSEYFNNFVRSTFLTSTISNRFGGGSFSVDQSNPLSIYPLYYSFVNKIESENSPLLNVVFEDYFKVSDNDPGASNFTRSILGLTNEERAAQKIIDKSLADIIKDTTYNQDLPTILKLKGELLFKTIGFSVGNEELKKELANYLIENPFRTIKLSEVATLLKNNFGLETNTIINKWFTTASLPAFYVTHLESYKLIDDNREKYQVKFNITNPTKTPGYVNLEFEPQRGGPGMGRFRRMMPGQGEETLLEKVLMIDSSQTVNVGLILDEEPGRLNLSTIISQNLPLQQEYNFREFEEKRNAVPFEGLTVLDKMVKYENVDEIVVDNEDEGFETTHFESSSWLKDILSINNDDDEKYIGIRFWDVPKNWRATIVSDAYGKFVHSVHFTRPGDGSVKATWNADITNSGYYDVYAYIVKPRIGFGPPGFGPNNHNSRSENIYTVYSDDGDNEVNLNVGNADEGWNLLGSYYYSEGKAKVELSNKSEGQAVFADAVKWVIRN